MDIIDRCHLKYFSTTNVQTIQDTLSRNSREFINPKLNIKFIRDCFRYQRIDIMREFFDIFPYKRGLSLVNEYYNEIYPELLLCDDLEYYKMYFEQIISKKVLNRQHYLVNFLIECIYKKKDDILIYYLNKYKIKIKNCADKNLVIYDELKKRFGTHGTLKMLTEFCEIMDIELIHQIYEYVKSDVLCENQTLIIELYSVIPREKFINIYRDILKMFKSDTIEENKRHNCTFTLCSDPKLSKYYYTNRYYRLRSHIKILEICIELLGSSVIQKYIDEMIPIGGFAYVSVHRHYRKGFYLIYHLNEILFISKYFPDLIEELPIHIIELIPQCCEENHVKLFQYITNEYYYDFTTREYSLFRKTLKNQSFDVAKLIMKELNFILPYHLYSDYLELVRYRAGHIIYRNLRSYCGRISLKK
jgi:hypothetical protein